MIFSLYLTRAFALSAGAALLVLGALAELLDLLDNGNVIMARYGRVADLAIYAGLITPTIAASIIPIASLIGALIAFGNLAGHNEIVAMRSSGMTLYWIVARLAPVALIIGLLYFTLRFVVAPYTEIQVFEMLRESDKMEQTVAEPESDKGAYWISSGPMLMGFESTENEGRRIRRVTLVQRDAQGAMLRHIRATEGRFENDGWRFDGVTIRNVGAGGAMAEKTAQFMLPDGPQPIDILTATIPNARVRLTPPGLPAAKIWAGSNSPANALTNFYEALAAPFVPLIMLLAAAPLALGTARHPSRARDMGIAVCTGFGFLLASGIFRSLGESGMMPPLLAVWGPVVIFSLAGVSILAHREG